MANDRRANGPAALLMNEILDHLDAGMSGADAWRTALRLPPRKASSKTTSYSELKARTLRAAEVASPLDSAPTLPRTPVAEPGRDAAVARGDSDRGSGLLSDSDALAQRAAAWIAREQKRTGLKPSWKEALVAVSRQASQVDAAEVSAPARADSRGFQWTWQTGWHREQPDPRDVAREVALRAERNAPEIIRGAEDTTALRDRAVTTMRQRKQDTDPKSSDFAENYKRALTEASEA